MINASQRANTLAAVLLFDVENFRLINDTLGRHVGDRLLKLIAELAKGEFRSSDNLACVGADCFAVMVPELRQEADVARIVEEQILKPLAQPVRVGDQELRTSVKVGIALSPSDGIDADTLLKNAEAALKRAKESKERYLFYASEMNARAADRFALESRLRRAVEQGQFVLHFQPKISLANGRLTGLEALLRWNDPEAEGVALEEQARFLRLLRCDERQGYLFSPPVPVDRIEAMLVADPTPSLSRVLSTVRTVHKPRC